MYDATWEEMKERQRLEDRTLNVRFYWGTVLDGPASKAEGREIHRPIEMCEIRMPADRQSSIVTPAHAEFKKFADQIVTYAMRLEDQYRRFRATEQQVISGTPLATANILDAGEIATLKVLDVHTVEQLAALSGQALKNLGPGGMKWQQAAENFIKTTKDGAEVSNLIKENALLKEQMAASSAQGPDPRIKYAELADGDLKDLIKERTGEFPRGNPSRI
jgi:hypothetical protein